MARRVLGIDLDGVLADFNNAFAKKLYEVTGRDLCPDVTDPPCWEWPTHYGYTKEESKATWKNVEKDDMFWQSLNTLPNCQAFLEAIQSSPDDNIYFITSRPGINAKLQSENWLEIHGFTWPTVLVVSTPEDKAMVAKALKITHFIDDKAENCLAVKEACPETQVFLVHRNYNVFAQVEAAAKGVPVIRDIMQFITALEAQNVRD